MTTGESNQLALGKVDVTARMCNNPRRGRWWMHFLPENQVVDVSSKADHIGASVVPSAFLFPNISGALKNYKKKKLKN